MNSEMAYFFSFLRCLFMHLRQCMRGASVGKPVQSAVFCCPHVRLVCCSAILHSSIVSGLFLSAPPASPLLFSTVYILYQCDGCPSSLLRGSS